MYKTTQAISESSNSLELYSSLRGDLGRDMPVLKTGTIVVIMGAAIILGLALFITFFLIFTKRFSTYLEEITEGIANVRW